MRIAILAFYTVAFSAVCLFLIPVSAQTPERAVHHLLFSRAGPGEPGEIAVFIANSDGSDERPLGPSTSLEYNPAWFPDGQSLVFTSERMALQTCTASNSMGPV